MSIKITNFEIMIDGVTYRADSVYQVSPPPDTRRLIISLIRPYEENGDLSEASGELIVARSHALKAALAKKFPQVAKPKQISTILSTRSEWKYILTGVGEGCIEWAKAAKESGMIDSYIVDYAP